MPRHFTRKLGGKNRNLPYNIFFSLGIFFGPRHLFWESAEINAYRQVGHFFCLEEFVGMEVLAREDESDMEFHAIAGAQAIRGRRHAMGGNCSCTVLSGFAGGFADQGGYRLDCFACLFGGQG